MGADDSRILPYPALPIAIGCVDAALARPEGLRQTRAPRLRTSPVRLAQRVAPPERPGPRSPVCRWRKTLRIVGAWERWLRNTLTSGNEERGRLLASVLAGSIGAA